MFKNNDKTTRRTSLTSFCFVFIINFEHITPISSVSIVEFEQVNVSWELFVREQRTVVASMFAMFIVKVFYRFC